MSGVTSTDREAPLLRHVMPELDAVRGIAVLMVVAYHAFFWSYHVEQATGIAWLLLRLTQPGWLGVQLFFVLSGFLITGILLDQQGAGRYFAPFYARRALRILPAYAVVLIVALVTGVVSARFALVATLFLTNLFPLLAVGLEYGVLWSLAIEEQFYLVWPLAVRRLSRSALASVALLALVIGPLARGWAWMHGERVGLYFYTWFNLDGLAMGALLALWMRRGDVTRGRVTRAGVVCLSVATATIALGAPFGILTRNALLGGALQYTPWCLAAAGALALTMIAGSGPRARFVQPRWLRFYGEISYGLYLSHLLVFMALDYAFARLAPALSPGAPHLGPMLVRAAIGISLSTAVSWASRRSVEAWFLSFRGHWVYGRVSATG